MLFCYREHYIIDRGIVLAYKGTLLPPLPLTKTLNFAGLLRSNNCIALTCKPHSLQANVWRAGRNRQPIIVQGWGYHSQNKSTSTMKLLTWKHCCGTCCNFPWPPKNQSQFQGSRKSELQLQPIPKQKNTSLNTKVFVFLHLNEITDSISGLHANLSIKIRDIHLLSWLSSLINEPLN